MYYVKVKWMALAHWVFCQDDTPGGTVSGFVKREYGTVAEYSRYGILVFDDEVLYTRFVMEHASMIKTVYEHPVRVRVEIPQAAIHMIQPTAQKYDIICMSYFTRDNVRGNYIVDAFLPTAQVVDDYTRECSWQGWEWSICSDDI